VFLLVRKMFGNRPVTNLPLETPSFRMFRLIEEDTTRTMRSFDLLPHQRGYFLAYFIGEFCCDHIASAAA